MQSQISRLPTRRDLEDLEYYKCATDWRYWITNHGWMNDGEGGVMGPGLSLWDQQWEFAEAYAAGEDLIALKARQLGFSWIATNLDCYDLIFKSNIELGCVAMNDSEEVGSMFHKSRLQWVYDQQTPHIARSHPTIKNKHVLRLNNGSRFSAVPCTGKVRGQGWKRTRLEEFAFFANAREVWTALMGQAGMGRRQVAVISTANGEGGEYHAKWTEAEAGSNDLRPIFLGWRANPEHDDDWYAAQRRRLGAKVKQEHPETADEAFLASGTKYFDASELKRLQSQHGMVPLRVMFGASGIGEEAKLAGLHIGLRIYSEPVKGRQYAIGADTSDGGGDACAATVLDVETGKQVAQYISYTDRSGQFGDALAVIGHQYNTALIACEINNTGHGTCVALEKLKYPNLYRRPDGELHWRTSESTREPLLDAYRAVIDDRAVTLHDLECYRQARIFCNVKGKWQHPEGDHDDCVFSPAIAQQARAVALKQRQRKKTPAVYQDGKPIN